MNHVHTTDDHAHRHQLLNRRGQAHDPVGEAANAFVGICSCQIGHFPAALQVTFGVVCLEQFKIQDGFHQNTLLVARLLHVLAHGGHQWFLGNQTDDDEQRHSQGGNPDQRSSNQGNQSQEHHHKRHVGQ